MVAPNTATANHKRVLVVGGGCAGLSAAWHLNRIGVDVLLCEKEKSLGGHANTIEVDGVHVDTGFMVYNSINYPNLCEFFETIGVRGQDTFMGFSVSMDNGRFEWCGDSLLGLIATPSNLVNTKFYSMVFEITRFNRIAREFLSIPYYTAKAETVEEFLKKNNFADSFRDGYLLPMTAAIWSASTQDVMRFPALTLFTFLQNHLLLQVTDQITWRTPCGRSHVYVKAVHQALGTDKVCIGNAVMSVSRSSGDSDRSPSTRGERNITAVFEDGSELGFDDIVFACHPDEALKILGDEATEDEKRVLGAFQFSSNDTYVHCDEDLMPRSKKAWTSWNYIGKTKELQSSSPAAAASNPSAAVSDKPVFVTYWLNKLQHLNHPRNIFVTLNPGKPPSADKTFARIDYSHPQYTLASVAAQKEVEAVLQGQNHTFYCGAWMGYGFHEDAFKSGKQVACMLSNGKIKPESVKQITLPTAAVTNGEGRGSVVTFVQGFFASALVLLWGILSSLFEVLCEQQVILFLSASIKRGKLMLILPGGREVTFGSSDSGHTVVVKVQSRWLFVRLALESDLGLCKSYIAGEWDVIPQSFNPASPIDHATSVKGEITKVPADIDGLTRFLELLVDNMSNTGKKGTGAGVDKLLTAWIGSVVNYVWYRLTMDNSIANSRSNIHAHYDLSNALFEEFLDMDLMMYSSAQFNTEIKDDPKTGLPKIIFTGTLEDAQTRKVDALLARLEPLGPQHVILDIGCGWGGIAIRAAQKYGCKVHGITLSIEQLQYAEKKIRCRGLSHLITLELVDYRIFAKQCSNGKCSKFDRIVSCEMIEAVGHNHLGSFFASVDTLLRVDGIFVMQAITMPDSRYAVYKQSADFLNTIIFPGGCCPSVSALLDAMTAHSTLHLESANNTNLHYAETLRRWCARFNAKLVEIRALGFDTAFIRLWNLYLCYCEAGFRKQIINLQILTFSRTGNANMVKHRVT